MLICLSSVCRHISKTKQDRPTVGMEHYAEVDIANSVAAFRSFPRRPLGRYSAFKCWKICSNINPLMGILNRRVTDHYTTIWRMVHWPLMGGLLHLVQRGGAWVGCGPAHPLLAVPNVTTHQLTASVLTSYCLMWHYNYQCPLKGEYGHLFNWCCRQSATIAICW